jgi:uncharacterized protein YukE
MNEIMVIILCSIAIIVTIIVICLYVKYSKLANQKKKEYHYWQDAVETLVSEKNKIDNRIEVGKATLADIHHKVDFADECLKDLNRQYDITKDHLDDIKKVANDNEAKLKDEYDKAAQKYQDELNQFKQSCDNEKQIVQASVNSLKATRNSIIDAYKREEQMSQDQEKYKLNLDDIEIRDIVLLNDVRMKISSPQVVGKVIWQSYLQKKMKELSISLLGRTDKVCGIYKITNIKNHKSYIGQSVDIYKRWCDHCKCGVGATETSMTNQLYKAMRKDGIENFTFELLEECPREELNKKESFYIDLYESNSYGYNQTQGNN